jgi:hypothetical protein
MNELTTTLVMIFIFCVIGVALPVILMLRDKTQQSSLPNKLILWITMVFCMILVFGVVIDFRSLSESIRADLIQYGFIALMLFGAIFGIDQLLKQKYIKTVKWKDLTVETDRGRKTKGLESEQGEDDENELGEGDENEPGTDKEN